MLTKLTKKLNLNGTSDAAQRVSPQPPTTTETDCNSEDSSLSDSDRTLVDDNSPFVSDNRGLSPDDRVGDHKNVALNCDRNTIRSYYFKCEEYTEPAITSDMEPVQVLKVLVDKSMIMGKLKDHLETIVKVPQAYFKICRAHSIECSRMSEQLSSFV